MFLSHLEVHELHEFGDLRFQHLHSLLIDLHSVGLLITLDLKPNKRVISIMLNGKLTTMTPFNYRKKYFVFYNVRYNGLEYLNVYI